MKIFLLVPLLCLTFICKLHAGEREVTGGDSYAIAFVQFGQTILQTLTKNYPKEMPAIDLKELKHVLKKTRVESAEEPLVLDGIEKDALNFPDKMLIKVSRSAWRNAEGQAQRFQLVLHEYLGIMRVDDKSYQISSRFWISTNMDSGIDPIAVITGIKTLPNHDPTGCRFVRKLEPAGILKVWRGSIKKEYKIYSDLCRSIWPRAARITTIVVNQYESVVGVGIEDSSLLDISKLWKANTK